MSYNVGERVVLNDSVDRSYRGKRATIIRENTGGSYEILIDGETHNHFCGLSSIDPVSSLMNRNGANT